MNTTLIAESLPTSIATPSYQIETITPEYAESILQTSNVGNRPYRRGKVLELVHIIKSGQWVPTSNDAICFAPDGTLINGQHRLMAIVASRCTVQTLVGRNIPHEAYRGMDRGAQRSFSDTVNAMGVDYAADVAATAKHVICFAKPLGVPDLAIPSVHQSPGGHGRYLTVYEIETFVTQHPYLRTAVSMALTCKKIIPTRTLAAWVFAQYYNRKDMEMVGKFVETMNVLDGNIEQDTCSAVVLGRQLIRYRAERRKVDVLALWPSLDIAFNEFCKGTSRHRGYVISKATK